LRILGSVSSDRSFRDAEFHGFALFAVTDGKATVVDVR
jgi:hypothetical protein